jgi:hypothetical protein
VELTSSPTTWGSSTSQIDTRVTSSSISFSSCSARSSFHYLGSLHSTVCSPMCMRLNLRRWQWALCTLQSSLSASYCPSVSSLRPITLWMALIGSTRSSLLAATNARVNGSACTLVSMKMIGSGTLDGSLLLRWWYSLSALSSAPSLRLCQPYAASSSASSTGWINTTSYTCTVKSTTLSNHLDSGLAIFVLL